MGFKKIMKEEYYKCDECGAIFYGIPKRHYAYIVEDWKGVRFIDKEICRGTLRKCDKNGKIVKE